ncbi:hypothetical protein PG993_010673 [Apiospora rasikravindrae]|uniref:Uncharacterized protein n=1 Tax=Apiospora rasikravindrae TaxID=990691 RepID=A0ABR1SMW1_9PEZI
MPSPPSNVISQVSSRGSGSSASAARDYSSTFSFDLKPDEKTKKDDTKASIEQCMKSARKNALKQWS